MNEYNFTKLEDIFWVKTPYLKTSEEGPAENHTFAYELLLPSYLAGWDVWSYWERERVNHMKKYLKKGDVLFDVGAEFGWMSVVFADMVGAENMVLIEPTAQFWPNIKAIWEKNDLAPPLACYEGLVGDEEYSTGAKAFNMGWSPDISDWLIDRMAYRYVHNNQKSKLKNQVPETKIDTLVKQQSIIPDALTIDVEGAELLVLRGAEKTIKKYKPQIWVSIHPDLALRDYGVKDGECQKYLENLGYKLTCVNIDHEEHWYASYTGGKK